MIDFQKLRIKINKFSNDLDLNTVTLEPGFFFFRKNEVDARLYKTKIKFIQR